jgi:hypothetical protein
MEQLSSVPLNQGQQQAADGFFEFLFSKDKELCISGPGGVGKTYLMGHLIDAVMPQYLATCKMMGITAQYTEVEMTATTNKAAEVLSSATGRPCGTIFSFMRLTVKEDNTTGKTFITKSRDWVVHKNKIIFVDEASMIDTPLRNYILEGTHDCKIVYVGDHCQLAPVMEPLSPVYRESLPFYELTEPMRTNLGPLQLVNLQLRETVKTGEFHPIRIVPGVIDHLDGEQMEHLVNTTFREQTKEARILGYTNNQVMAYNGHIRGIRALPEELTVGELVICNSAIQLKNSRMKVEQELEVLEVSPLLEPVTIDDNDTELMIRRAMLKSQWGTIYADVMVPADRSHYDQLLKYYKSHKLWNRFFFLKNNFPDLRPRDAATVHKAQGSTYDTVFIDLDDVSSCRNPDTAARLFYVAFSRARSRVVLYGELADKYGGLIH